MTPEEKRVVVKNRRRSNLFVVTIMLLAMILFQYSDELLRYIDPQAASLGIDILQPGIVAAIYVLGGSAFATMMAAFYEGQLREDSFGTWSRFGILFFLFFLGFVAVSGAIL